MGLGKPGIEGRDAAACPETQGFGLAETSKPLRAGPFTLRACKIPGIREMARRAKAAAAAGFEDSEGFCKSLFVYAFWGVIDSLLPYLSGWLFETNFSHMIS